MRKGIGFENLADRPAVCVDLVEYDVDAVTRQVLGQFLGGVFGIEALFVGDRNDAHLSGPFEQGECIGNRPGRGPAEIPGDGHGPEFERTRARGFRQDKGRPARSEDHCLGGRCVDNLQRVIDAPIQDNGDVERPLIMLPEEGRELAKNRPDPKITVSAYHWS